MPVGMHRTADMTQRAIVAKLRATLRAHIEKGPSLCVRGLVRVLCFLALCAVTWTVIGAGQTPEARGITAGSRRDAIQSCAGILAGDEHWWDGLEQNALNGKVEALVLHNGYLVAGGWFSEAGGKPANSVARWDGRAWSALGEGIVGNVYALGVYDGDLFAGGGFSSYPTGDSITDVARWDGDSWRPVGDSLGFNPNVLAFAVYEDDLIAAGRFVRISDGDTILSVARLDGAHWESMEWRMRGDVRSLTIYDGCLIAGGRFTETEDDSVGNIAWWDGDSWNLLGGGTDRTVEALTIYDGDLIACGDFEEAGGNSARGVARWDGKAWGPLGQGVWGVDVWALCTYDTSLIAGGFFEYAGGLEASDIALWDGQEWRSLGSGIEYAPRHVGVFALAPYEGSLYAGGAFLTAGGKPSNYIARWDDMAPEVEISIFQNPYLTQYLDVYVVASEFLDSVSIEVDFSSLPIPVRCVDSVGKVWLGDCDVGVTSDSLRVAACAWDIVGNQSCGSRAFFPGKLISENPDADQMDHERSLYIGPAYPNPCNTVTAVPLDIVSPQHVRATVYDASGRHVVRLLDRYLEAGLTAVVWDGSCGPGRTCAGGLYFIRFETRTQLLTRRIMLVR